MNELGSNSRIILYYSDTPSEEKGYGSFLKSLDSTILMVNSLDHFYSEHKSRNDLLFALIDIQNVSNLVQLHSDQRNNTLDQAPLFIILGSVTTIPDTYPLK